MADTMSKHFNELLPWYLNGTLDEAERQAVEAELRVNPELQQELNAWRLLRSAAQSQPQVEPPPALLAGLLRRVEIRPGRQTALRPALARLGNGLIGCAVAALIWLALWWIIQPGVELRWAAQGEAVQSFRVYRAETAEGDFQLLRELPAAATTPEYNFTDTASLPWSKYQYLVEAVTLSGQSVFSRVIEGDSSGVILLQGLLLFTSLAVGASLVMLVSFRRPTNRLLIGSSL